MSPAGTATDVAVSAFSEVVLYTDSNITGVSFKTFYRWTDVHGLSRI